MGVEPRDLIIPSPLVTLFHLGTLSCLSRQLTAFHSKPAGAAVFLSFPELGDGGQTENLALAFEDACRKA